MGLVHAMRSNGPLPQVRYCLLYMAAASKIDTSPVVTARAVAQVFALAFSGWVLVFIPNKFIISVASLGRCIFIGHNISLGHARALLPFHMAVSTCLIGKWKWLRAWAINPANIVHVGGCVFMLARVFGYQIRYICKCCLLKGCLWCLAYHSSAIIIVIYFWNVIITNTQTWIPFVLK
jgi:hypothetical protein